MLVVFRSFLLRWCCRWVAFFVLVLCRSWLHRCYHVQASTVSLDWELPHCFTVGLKCHKIILLVFLLLLFFFLVFIKKKTCPYKSYGTNFYFFLCKVVESYYDSFQSIRLLFFFTKYSPSGITLNSVFPWKSGQITFLTFSIYFHVPVMLKIYIFNLYSI